MFATPASSFNEMSRTKLAYMYSITREICCFDSLLSCREEFLCVMRSFVANRQPVDWKGSRNTIDRLLLHSAAHLQAIG